MMLARSLQTAGQTLCNLALSALLLGPVGPAAAADDSETELAKKTQNPVADLISVPFQSSFNFNTGTKDATVYVLNVHSSPGSGDDRSFGTARP